jgi:hypothetical protein
MDARRRWCCHYRGVNIMPTNANVLVPPEDGTMEHSGADGFYSVHMRCTLRICLTGLCCRLATGRFDEASTLDGVR